MSWDWINFEGNARGSLCPRAYIDTSQFIIVLWCKSLLSTPNNLGEIDLRVDIVRFKLIYSNILRIY